MATKTAETIETTTERSTRLYLLSALTKDGPKTLSELTKLVAQVGSTVDKAEDLGLKRLAFAINKTRELTLVSVYFQADRQILTDLTSELKHAETVERYLLTDWKAGLESPKRGSRRDEPKKSKTEGTESENV